jgi:hypothetical protein
MHLWGCNPYTSSNEGAKDNSPETQKYHQHRLGYSTLGTQSTGHGRDDQHAAGHTSVTSKHRETPTSILNNPRTRNATNEDAQCDDEVDEERIADADSREENRCVRDHKLGASNG